MTGKFENIKHTQRHRIYDSLSNIMCLTEKDLGVHIDAELKFEEHMVNRNLKS